VGASATPRALERYSVAEAIRHTASVQLEGIEIGSEKPWVRITRDDFAAAGVDAFSTNPSMTRTIIATAATATGNVEIHRGVTIEDLLHDERGATGVRGKRGEATLTLEARLVVGDDGGSSVVRTQLGIPIMLDMIPIEFVTAMITRCHSRRIGHALGFTPRDSTTVSRRRPSCLGRQMKVLSLCRYGRIA
jgi:2-polyprenyl-6-methoxyphenol hydroxylase-like FAD-dependent oxidoreductase